MEPVPDLCIPSELEKTLKASRLVDVVSPNHEELGGLFGFVHPSSGPIDCGAVEKQAAHLVEHGIIAGRSAVVVRAGKEGCLVAVSDQKNWFPAALTDLRKIVDPTGAGNGFLGGFAVGFVRCDCNVLEAARWGSVAASFCIQQVGVPVLSDEPDSVGELWDNSLVRQRLEMYRSRTC